MSRHSSARIALGSATAFVLAIGWACESQPKAPFSPSASADLTSGGQLAACKHGGPPPCGGGDGSDDGGDPPGQDQGVKVDFVGSVVTTSDQSVVITRETKSDLRIAGGTSLTPDQFWDELRLASAAGFPGWPPNPGDPEAFFDEVIGQKGSVVDPPDTGAATVARLIDILDDENQERGLLTVRIDMKNLSDKGRHVLKYTWFDDVNDGQYRTNIRETSLTGGHLITMTEVATDVFEFNGGNVYVLDLGDTNAEIACPNNKTVTMTIVR